MSEKTFFGLLPPQATAIAAEVDALFIFITVISLIFFVLVIGLMLYFVRKYRAENNPVIDNIHENVPLEITWTLVPTLLLAIIFVWGFVVYKDMSTPPGSTYEVRAIGKQWLWQFQYENGKTTVGDLVVPAGQAVKVVMTAEDVLHSLFIPDFRVKKDAVPGMYTHIWFKADEPGEHVIYCAEYCGTSHSNMLGKVIVKSPADFETWISAKEGEGQNLTLAQKGEQLLAKNACTSCHSIDGSTLVGPTFKGVWGREELMTSGNKITVDDAYIRESILEPSAKIVKGFETQQMPTFKGSLKEEDINAIIAYLTALK